MAEASYSRSKDWKAKLRREIARDLRAKDRKTLEALRAAIADARAARREAIAAIRQDCRLARVELRHKAAEARQQLREAQREARVAARLSCSARASTARAEHALELDKRRQRYAETHQEQRSLRVSPTQPKKRITAAESRRDSDDAVASDLPPDLLPVWAVMKRTIHGSRNRTRTEAFLDWVHENADEVWAIQASAADKKLEALLRQEQELHRETRRAARYQRSAEKMQRDLAEVPF
jgi:hypothetical protein